MDRLTERLRDGHIIIKGCSTIYANKERKGAPAANAIVRLAAYEDTGMTPEEITGLCSMSERAKMADLLRLEEYQALGPIDHLRELVKAEKDGRLVVLPVKPGTKIFTHCYVSGEPPISHSYFLPPYIPTIGENAWLTCEEAEAALKKGR